jgi:hypothetical protein
MVLDRSATKALGSSWFPKINCATPIGAAQLPCWAVLFSAGEGSIQTSKHELMKSLLIVQIEDTLKILGAREIDSPQSLCIDRDDDRADGHEHRADSGREHEAPGRQHTGCQRQGDHVVASGP